MDWGDDASAPASVAASVSLVQADAPSEDTLGDMNMHMNHSTLSALPPTSHSHLYWQRDIVEDAASIVAARSSSAEDSCLMTAARGAERESMTAKVGTVGTVGLSQALSDEGGHSSSHLATQHPVESGGEEEREQESGEGVSSAVSRSEPEPVFEGCLMKLTGRLVRHWRPRTLRVEVRAPLILSRPQRLSVPVVL